MSPRFFYRSPLIHYTLLANSSLQKRNSASDSNRLFTQKSEEFSYPTQTLYSDAIYQLLKISVSFYLFHAIPYFCQYWHFLVMQR